MTTLAYRKERTRRGYPVPSYYNSTLRSACRTANIEPQDIDVVKALTEDDYVDARYQVRVSGVIVGEVIGDLEMSLATYSGTVLRRESSDRMTWKARKAGEATRRHESTYDTRIEAIVALIK